MLFDEFRALVAGTKLKQPRWFALESDRRATDTELQQAERHIGAALPEQYRRFVSEYGGGFFGFAKVFSVQPDSDFNLVAINRREGLVGSGFVAVSDNGAGDLYAFKVADGSCGASIWFHDHEANEWRKTQFADLLDFLAQRALRRS